MDHLQVTMRNNWNIGADSFLMLVSTFLMWGWDLVCFLVIPAITSGSKFRPYAKECFTFWIPKCGSENGYKPGLLKSSLHKSFLWGSAWFQVVCTMVASSSGAEMRCLEAWNAVCFFLTKKKWNGQLCLEKFSVSSCIQHRHRENKLENEQTADFPKAWGLVGTWVEDVSPGPKGRQECGDGEM